MHSRESFFQGGETHGKEVIVEGNPERSFVHSKTMLPSSDKKSMPPKDRLSQTQRELLGQWIKEGADWPDGVLLQKRERVTQADVVRILVRGEPLTGSDRDRLREWVDQGAPWDFPISFEIESVEQLRKERSEITLVQSLWRIIDQKKMPRTEAEMKPYKSTIPKTGVDYEMVPIPGGRYRMGSPPQRRKSRENPRRCQTRGYRIVSHHALHRNVIRNGEGETSRDQHDPSRGQQILPVAVGTDRALLSIAHRGRMGIRLPGGNDDCVFLWR